MQNHLAIFKLAKKINPAKTRFIIIIICKDLARKQFCDV